jgi:hypothetical protein
MIETLLGSLDRERVLTFLRARGQGYAREIARHFRAGLAPIQQQLDKLERGGILYSQLIGRTRLYKFDPRYPFLQEIGGLLDKVLAAYPDRDREALFMNRRRPRRRGKPL